jgi:hypothetical protein
VDAKEASLIKRHYDRVRSLSFDEDDVYALMILLRWSSKGQEPVVWELANFMTHRERDRGDFCDVLSRSRSFFNGDGIRPGKKFEVRPAFSEQKIKESFNSLFRRLGWDPVCDEAANGILLCMISLLHCARVVDKKGVDIGVLLFAYDNQCVYLFGRSNVQDLGELRALQVPVLQIQNHYLTPTSSCLQTPKMVQVVNERGRLRVLES